MTLKRKALTNIGLAALSSVFAILLVEAALRVDAFIDDKNTLGELVKSPAPKPRPDEPVMLAPLVNLSSNNRIIYELKPYTFANYLGTHVSTNSSGFRDRDYTETKPSHTARIVGIGDSTMFGHGVDDEQEYLSLLEDALKTVPGRLWEVINTAVPGYNTVMEVEALKAKGLKYAPDIVIIGVDSNDSSLPNFIRIRENYFTLNKSFLREFASQRLAGKKPTKKDIGDMLTHAPQTLDGGFESDPKRVPPLYRNMVGERAQGRALEELRALSERWKFDVIAVFFQDMRDSFAFKKSVELGFHTVEIYPFVEHYMAQNNIEKFEGSPLAVSENDPHPSAFLHKMAANEIFGYMVKSGIIEKYSVRK